MRLHLINTTLAGFFQTRSKQTGISINDNKRSKQND